MRLLALLFALIAVVGLGEIGASTVLVWRFARRHPMRTTRPALSILKPLKGAEPLLEPALGSFLSQDYPTFQVIFGAADGADPALTLARSLARRFPDRDVTFVAGHDRVAPNRKVANLIAMAPYAAHELIVIADQDVHAPADALDALAAALADPAVGLASVLYVGVPGAPGIIGRLGAARITHDFLPATLLGRALGRADTLGAVMAVRGEVLERIGGFDALSAELADDAVLGRKVKALGLKVVLADCIVGTTVAERGIGALYRHELRWARTIRSLAPFGFAASATAYPLAFAALALLVSAAASWAVLLFLAVWAVRLLLARGVERALDIKHAVLPFWAFPLRDILSLTELLVSYAGNRVEWRGAVLRAGHPGRGTCAPVRQKGSPNR